MEELEYGRKVKILEGEDGEVRGLIRGYDEERGVLTVKAGQWERGPYGASFPPEVCKQYLVPEEKILSIEGDVVVIDNPKEVDESRYKKDLPNVDGKDRRKQSAGNDRMDTYWF